MALQYGSPSAVLSTSGFSSLASINTTAGATGYSATATANSTVNLVDVHCVVTIVTPATWTPTTSTSINIYVIGSEDNSNWCDGMTPHTASGSATLSANGNSMKFLGYLPATAASGTFKTQPMSIAAAFGGTIPKYFAICIQNNLPATYSTTAGNSNAVSLQDVYYN